MRRIRGFLTCSLIFVIKNNFAYPQDCDFGRNAYACFKYEDFPLFQQLPQQGWKSFQKIDEFGFTSLNDYDGQYVPKESKDLLRIKNINAILVLKKLFQDNVFYINKVKEGIGEVFLMDSKDSIFFGKIGFIKSRNQENFQNKIADLVFDGGKIVDVGILEQYEGDGQYRKNRRVSKIIESKYENDRKWALIGDVSNSLGGRVSMDFKNGAKMLGDFYAYYSAFDITFGHSPQTLVSFTSLPVVFEGGLYNLGGRIDFRVESGGARIDSVGWEEFGIFAENGGENILHFTDTLTNQNPQYLLSSQMLAQTNISHISKTQNTINFKNAKTDEQNFMQIYDVIADSGQNTIQTLDVENRESTQLQLIVERSILSMNNPDATHYDKNKIGNNIIIDGRLNVGEYAMKTLENYHGVFGIMTWGGNNVIKLKDTLLPKDDLSGIVAIVEDGNSGYYEDRTLLTPRIYASGEDGSVGENHIEIDGDLKLVYLEGYGENGRDVIGAEIIASDGGSNTVMINGIVDVVGYRRRLEDSLGTFINEEIKKDEKNFLNTFIGVYGDEKPSKNTLIVRNTDVGGLFNGAGFRDLILGDIVAYGGSNEIVLYAPLCEDWKGVEIKSLIAGNKDLLGKRHLGGRNDLTIFNGVDIVIKKILTQEGGANHVWILQGEEVSDINQNSDLGISYGEGGETLLYFGIGSTKSNLSSAIKIGLDSQGGKKNLNLSVGKNKEENLETYNITIMGTFSGAMQYLKDGDFLGNLGEINYALENDSIFVGWVVDDKRIEQGISVGDGAKFIPKNDGKIDFEILAIDASEEQETKPLKKTIDMKNSVIDLATNGGSFTNISKRAMPKTLDVKSFLIQKSSQNNPFVRLYVHSSHQTDCVVVQEMISDSVGIDAQIFLPTELIGYDFSNGNAIIFSADKGGDDLEISSKIAQTGIVTYTTEIIKETQKNNVENPEEIPYSWKLGKSKAVVIDPDFISFAGILLAHNYGLFHIHFNSLNKRMGDLRGEENIHGVWGRVFGGEQINKYAYQKIDSGYFAFQGGYDHSFGGIDSDNFLGIAFSYAMMDSKSQAFVGSYLFDTPFAYDAFSHSVELGIYNAYLHHSGFFADTVAKIGYLTTDFRGLSETSIGTRISNITFTLGQELGYQFKFGGSDQWFVTPQFEMILGYLSQSNIRQEYDGQTLQSTLDGVLILRNRLGSEMGYILSKDRSRFEFKMGIGYVFDYAYAKSTHSILGAEYIRSVVKPAFISPDQKMLLNAGMNISLDKHTRLYFDVESSFFGKIRTKYQVNAGIRYSFGDRIQHLKEEKAKEIYTKLIAQ